MTVVVRHARPGDGATLREVERAAGMRFRDIGMDAIADHEPRSTDALADYARDGRSWVVVDATGAVAGFVLVDVVDEGAHVEQMSVRPDCQGAGICRALLDRVRAWAMSTGKRAITLTTFTEVPWNRPLYEHLGFKVMPDLDIGPALRAVRDAETAAGIDPATRVCMRLALID